MKKNKPKIEFWSEVEWNGEVGGREPEYESESPKSVSTATSSFLNACLLLRILLLRQKSLREAQESSRTSVPARRRARVGSTRRDGGRGSRELFVAGLNRSEMGWRRSQVEIWDKPTNLAHSQVGDGEGSGSFDTVVEHVQSYYELKSNQKTQKGKREREEKKVIQLVSTADLTISRVR